MIQEDHRNPETIREVILWSQEDDYWKNVILSPLRLMKHFDELELRMKDGEDEVDKRIREFRKRKRRERESSG